MTEKTIRLPIGDNTPTARLLYGVGVLDGIKVLEPASVHAVVTSPPYWNLRSYQVEGQIGCEESVLAYVNLNESYLPLVEARILGVAAPEPAPAIVGSTLDLFGEELS